MEPEMNAGPTKDRLAALSGAIAAAPDDAERAKLLCQAGKDQCPADAVEAGRLFREAIDAARRAGESLLMGRAAVDAAEAMMDRGQMDEATSFLRFIQEAAAMSAEKRDHLLGSHDYVAGELDYMRGDYDKAELWFESARERWGNVGHRAGGLKAQISLGNIAGLLGDIDTALAHFRDAYALAEEMGDIELKVNCTFNMGFALEQLGRWEEAAGCFSRVLADGQLQGQPYLTGDAYNCLGELYLRRNQLGRAIDLFRRAGEQLAGLAEHDDCYRDVLTNLGQAYHRQGDLEGARDAYDQALNHSITSHDRRLQAVVRWRLAELAIDRDDLAAAERSCEDSLAAAREIGARVVEADARRVQGLVLAARGEADRASAGFDEAISLLADTGDSYELALARLQFGRFLLDQGQQARSVELLEAAGRSFRRLLVVAEALEVNRLLFRAWLDRGREEALLDALTRLAAVGLGPGEYLTEALSLVCEALRFDHGAVFADGRAVAVQGTPDLAVARGLGLREMVDTPTVLSWPVLGRDCPVGRVYLERRAAPPVVRSPLVFEAVSKMLSASLESLSTARKG